MSDIRVSLVVPNDSDCYKFARARTRRMPLGLAYIGAALQQKGCDVTVTDASLHGYNISETVESALRNDPQFIGISCTTPIYHLAVAIIDQIKLKSPTTTVIIGGAHVSALPEATLKTSKADFVCIGEGEESIGKIIDAVQGKVALSSVPSIAYNRQGEIGFTRPYRLRLNQSKETTAPALDLDKLAWPARELFNYAEYTDAARGVEGAQTIAMFSRGCVGRCAFCNAAGTLVRYRETNNILDELEYIDKKLGIKHVFVSDDSYTVVRERVLAISRGIVERKINLTLSVQLRLDQLDEEVCEALYASGVRYVGPGIESGNEAMMKQVGKGPKENKEHIRQKMRILKKFDWMIRNSYVMGMPGETEAQILETIEFAKELDATENAFSIIVPYPGTSLWEIAKDRGLVNDYMDFRKFLYYHDVGCNLSAVPTERLLELHEYAYKSIESRTYQLAK
ncbi:MAG: radical SAM protein [bacterium]